MNRSVSAAVRRRACMAAFLILLIPSAALGQESARGDGNGPTRARKLFDPSSWLRPRVANPRATNDPAPRLVRQDPPTPDLKVPAANRSLGGGAPTADDDARSSSAATAGDSTAPTSSPTPDLGVPAADRSLGAGEPTDATTRAETESDEADLPKRIQDLLGYEDSPIKIHGWLQNSYTGNANGRGKTGSNLGVWPNHKADWWMGNQYYIVVENPLEMDDTVNFGFRFDSMFGNDWVWDFMQGLLNESFPLDSFAAYNPAQIYGEVHLPILTEGGVEVKGGRFYTLAGYEGVPAIARPLLSAPYMFTYGPFSHFGFMTTWHVTDRLNLYNGAVNGWDRWIDVRYAWGYIGGFSWTTPNDKTTLAMTAIWGPNQFPSFLPADQQLYLTGYVNVPSLAGKRNPGYRRNGRTMFTWVGTHEWNDRLTQVVESDQGWERAIPGLASGGRNGAPRDATWFSFGNWFLYEFSPKLTGVWRSEIYWDPQGARIQNMVDGQFVGDRYYEMTVGAIYKPHPNLWIRPEARHDWSQFHPAYTDDTRKNQFTLGVDAIILW